MNTSGEDAWHRYGFVVKDGKTDAFLDGRWIYSDPHPGWWHPFDRRRSKLNQKKYKHLQPYIPKEK